MKKRLKTTNIQDENVEDKDDEGINDNEATNQKQGELYKHVKDSNKGDTETLDAATNVCILLKKINLIINYFIFCF